MEDHTEKVIEHSRNPRNRGTMAHPDGVGRVADILTVFIRVKNNIISDIRYEIRDCPASVACASIMTELAIGKDLDEAIMIDNEDIIDALGGLPESEVYCSNRAATGLREAIINHVYGRRGRKEGV